MTLGLGWHFYVTGFAVRQTSCLTLNLSILFSCKASSSHASWTACPFVLLISNRYIFYSDKSTVYYFHIKATNNYEKMVELVSTMSSSNTFDIKPGAIFTLKVKSNSPNRVIFRAYDKRDGTPIPINTRFSASLLPTETLESVPQELIIGEGRIEKQNCSQMHVVGTVQNIRLQQYNLINM